MWLVLVIGVVLFLLFSEIADRATLAAQRADHRRYAAWARGATADQLWIDIRPTIEMLANRHDVAHAVEPLLSQSHWTDAALLASLHELLAANRATGDYRLTFWYHESFLEQVVAALAERVATSSRVPPTG